MILGRATEHDRARAIGEDERHQPSVAARMLAVVRVHLGSEVSRWAVARHHERSRRRFRDQIRRRGPPRGGQSGAPEIVMDEVGVAPQPELGGQVSQMVLTSDRVGRGADVHEHVDVRRIDVGILECRAGGPKREIAVVQASLRTAALAVRVEVEVEATFDDTDVSFDPLRFEQPSVRTCGPNPIEDLSIRHPVSRARTTPSPTTRRRHRYPVLKSSAHSSEPSSPIGVEPPRAKHSTSNVDRALGPCAARGIGRVVDQDLCTTSSRNSSTAGSAPTRPTAARSPRNGHNTVVRPVVLGTRSAGSVHTSGHAFRQREGLGDLATVAPHRGPWSRVCNRLAERHGVDLSART